MNFKKTAEEKKDKPTKNKDGKPMDFKKTAEEKKESGASKPRPNTRSGPDTSRPMDFKGTAEAKKKPKTFKEAFAAARKKYIAGGGKESDYIFTWDGKKYHILRGDDAGNSLKEKKKKLKEKIKKMKQGGKAPRGANMGGMMSGGPRKKATASSTGLSMNMGGMMSGQKRKKDQSSATGLAMKKGGMAYGKKGYKHGGMTDYRKSGMFRGGATRRGK